MAYEQRYGPEETRLGFWRSVGILWPYLRTRFLDQVRSVWFIVAYLLLFQIVILRLPIVFSAMISVGLIIVATGLMFFMEGLRLGLMPFGETIGAVLPRNCHISVILIFAFILGLGATFAEPAIAVLKAAGAGVQPTQAPLLYSLLSDFPQQLVTMVGAGVGLAVLLGILRFFYGWSLKTLVIPGVLLLSVITILFHFNESLSPIIGLAWDCGAVTTGPVTVPLVLALGIGVCRIVGAGDSSNAGFGIVTLASLFPILAVLLLGLFHYMADDYYGQPNYGKEVLQIHEADKGPTQPSIQSSEVPTPPSEPKAEGRFSAEEFERYLKTGEIPGNYRVRYEGGTRTLEDGQITQHSAVIVYEKLESPGRSMKDTVKWDPESRFLSELKSSLRAATQAIVPLCLFLFLTLRFLLKKRIRQADEIAVGVFFALLGMSLFGLGITLGLTPLGTQLGSNVPATFATITPWGLEGNEGPLFGAGFSGKLVAVIFAFFLGYGTTLAEPALNALGATVEKITVGSFRKSLLMQSVAFGVGLGIAVGVVKIAYNLPLTVLLIPPYIVLLVLTLMSSEEFVNFGWDSAGVTTGPITVPLVLAVGLGIGGKIPGVIDGFGVLALASVGPIITVLTVGLLVRRASRNLAPEIVAEETLSA